MSRVEKHVCSLGWCDVEPTPPSGWGRCAALRARISKLGLASENHHGYSMFLRSRKSLQLERARQLSTRGGRFVAHPYSMARYLWDTLILIINFGVFLYMPVQVFIVCQTPYDIIVLTGDVVAICNVIMNFMTGHVDEDGRRVVLDPKAIARRYLRGQLILDVLGALPLQLLPCFVSCPYPTHTAMFIFKLCRVFSIRDAWRNFRQQIELTYLWSVVVMLSIQVLFFLHWGTYFHYQVAVLCLQTHVLDEPTVKWLKTIKVIQPTPTSILDRYVTNLYCILGVCVGAGVYSPMEEPLVAECLITTLLGIMGLIFLLYAFTAMCRVVVYRHFENYLYHGRLKELHEYLQFKRLPQHLQTKVQLFINYKFNGHYFNEESIMRTLTDHLKQDINMHCCRRLVLNVPLFQGLPIALVHTIIFNLTQLLYMPGEVVVKCGQPGSSIYLIASGTVAIMNSAFKEVAHLKDGAYFGEKALMNPGIPRTATIIALEITEIYKYTWDIFGLYLEGENVGRTINKQVLKDKKIFMENFLLDSGNELAKIENMMTCTFMTPIDKASHKN